MEILKKQNDLLNFSNHPKIKSILLSSGNFYQI